MNALAGGELAGLVFALAAIGAAPGFRLRGNAVELFHAVAVFCF